MNTKCWILSICLFCGIQVFSQNENDSIEEISGTFVENAPQFREGDDSWQVLMDFINRYLRYPASAMEDMVEGRVIVQFWIDTSGNTDNHKVVRGIRDDLDNEALRVARLLNFEVPALIRGEPIRTMFILPFTFDLKRAKSITGGNLNYSEDSLRTKSKEFIISHSSRDFFDCLFELGITQINDNPKHVPCLSMDYYLKTSYGKRFYYRQMLNNKALTTNNIGIHFDGQQEITHYPDIEGIYQGFLSYQNMTLITEEEIKELSDSFSKHRNMKIQEVIYVFDLDLQKLYLEITRQKKYGSGVKETQLIDIQNNRLIKKDGPSFFRILFYYLGQIFY